MINATITLGCYSNGTKTCYMGHRRFLHEQHPFRFDEQKFGSTELRRAPTPLSGEEILECTKDHVTFYGKDPSRKKTSKQETQGRGAASYFQEEIYLVQTSILKRFNDAA